MRIKVDISPGELIDKLTILAIKQERIADPAKLANIGREKAALEEASGGRLSAIDGIDGLTVDLKAVNEELWEIEDAIRDHEQRGDFGSGFVELARAVYLTNDRRSAIKRDINKLLDSDIAEEKSYHDYRRA